MRVLRHLAGGRERSAGSVHGPYPRAAAVAVPAGWALHSGLSFLPSLKRAEGSAPWTSPRGLYEHSDAFCLIGGAPIASGDSRLNQKRVSR